MLRERRKMQDASLPNDKAAEIALENARQAHEKFLIRAHVSDFNSAVDNYISAIKLNPQIPQTYYRLASLMWESGEISLDTAIENCKKAVELDNKSFASYDSLGYVYSGLGEFDKAVEYWNKAFDESKNDIIKQKIDAKKIIE